LLTDNLEVTLRAFDDSGQSSLPVIASTGKTRILGFLSQNQALAYFNNALVASSEEEHRA